QDELMRIAPLFDDDAGAAAALAGRYDEAQATAQDRQRYEWLRHQIWLDEVATLRAEAVRSLDAAAQARRSRREERVGTARRRLEATAEQLAEARAHLVGVTAAPVVDRLAGAAHAATVDEHGDGGVDVETG